MKPQVSSASYPRLVATSAASMPGPYDYGPWNPMSLNPPCDPSMYMVAPQPDPSHYSFAAATSQSMNQVHTSSDSSGSPPSFSEASSFPLEFSGDIFQPQSSTQQDQSFAGVPLAIPITPTSPVTSAQKHRQKRQSVEDSSTSRESPEDPISPPFVGSLESDEDAANKRERIRREPCREEYVNEQAYLAAWNRWRIFRDRNNNAVRRIREMRRQSSMTSKQLQTQVKRLQNEVILLVKALARPETLDAEAASKVSEIIQTYLSEA